MERYTSSSSGAVSPSTSQPRTSAVKWQPSLDQRAHTRRSSDPIDPSRSTIQASAPATWCPPPVPPFERAADDRRGSGTSIPDEAGRGQELRLQRLEPQSTDSSWLALTKQLEQCRAEVEWMRNNVKEAHAANQTDKAGWHKEKTDYIAKLNTLREKLRKANSGATGHSLDGSPKLEALRGATATEGPVGEGSDELQRLRDPVLAQEVERLRAWEAALERGRGALLAEKQRQEKEIFDLNNQLRQATKARDEAERRHAEARSQLAQLRPPTQPSPPQSPSALERELQELRGQLADEQQTRAAAEESLNAWMQYARMQETTVRELEGRGASRDTSADWSSRPWKRPRTNP